MSSSLLIWNRADTKTAQGATVDVQAGDFDFGSEIPRLGWWIVVRTDAPLNVCRGFLSRRFTVQALKEHMTLDELLAASAVTEVASNEIGDPPNVIG